MTLSKLAAKVFSKVNYSFNILILTSKPTKCSTAFFLFFYCDKSSDQRKTNTFLQIHLTQSA